VYSVCGWQSVTHAVKRVPRSACPGTVCIPRSGGVAVRRAALCTGARRPHPRDPDRAPNRMCVSGASARSASGRWSLQVSVSGPTAGCRRDGVARARRAVGSRVPIRVVRSWTQRTGRVQWTRGGSWADSGCDGRAPSVGGGYGGLSPIPDSGYRKKKFHTQPHCASRRTTLFSPPVGNDVPRARCHPTRHASCSMSIASSLSHLEPNRTSLASTVTPGVLFSFLRNKRLASSLSP